MPGLKDPPVVIEGARLRLRRSTPDDALPTFRCAAHAEVMKHLDWPAQRSPAEARTYLEGCEQRWRAGTEFHWVIELKPAGAAVAATAAALDSAGMVGSIACRVHGRAADFGYLLAHAAWGHGFGTEAAALLMGWLQRQPEIVRIWATTDIDNTRSARVLEKLGLAREGVMRKATVRPQLATGPRDTVLYAWVREDPRPAV